MICKYETDDLRIKYWRAVVRLDNEKNKSNPSRFMIAKLKLQVDGLYNKIKEL